MDTTQGPNVTRIPIPTRDGKHFIHVHDIKYCIAQGKETSFLMIEKNDSFIGTLQLKKVQQLLSVYGNFCRVHKKFIVNRNCVIDYRKGKDGTLVMSKNDEVTLSRMYKAEYFAVWE